jgi:hypothetical protein
MLETMYENLQNCSLYSIAMSTICMIVGIFVGRYYERYFGKGVRK